MRKYAIGIIIFFVIVLFSISLANPVQAESTKKVETQPELKKIEATAYYDSYGNGHGADRRKLVEDLTIAGRIEDLGKTALLYDEEYRLIGIYEFRDTGYGQSTGQGKSRVCKGKSVGTIENGECVDIYICLLKPSVQLGDDGRYISSTLMPRGDTYGRRSKI